MGFRLIDFWGRDHDKGTTAASKLVTDYCEDLKGALPDLAYFLGDPDYDVQTLSSSAIFRSAIVKVTKPYADLAVDWRHPVLHEYDPTANQWVDSNGTGVRYEVKETSGKTVTLYYISIQFGNPV